MADSLVENTQLGSTGKGKPMLGVGCFRFLLVVAVAMAALSFLFQRFG
jgi:hypothetical protein